MSKIKPSIPSGTRDFSPEQVAKRNYIFNTIRNIFEKYGFQPIETPAMENLSTFTGKYGEEGDQLIFKILNSGDFLKDVSPEKLQTTNYKQLTSLIADKALRYDLTVPFARYVVQHQSEITFPFKRYQIQPVWRADRPQKGRYREFWQCDADVIGSDSLLNEVELIQIYDEVFSELGFINFTIKINNRKFLEGLADFYGARNRIGEFIGSMDKIEKIGISGAEKELKDKGFENIDLSSLRVYILTTDEQGKVNTIKTAIEYYKGLFQKCNSTSGLIGINELETLFKYFNKIKLKKTKIEFDCFLARGLNYYTGTIIEVKISNVQIGSVGGGGRYDNLTGMFGLPNVSGVGISFGADRIYDAMEELKLFPENIGTFTKVLFTNFDSEAEKYALQYLQKVRQEGINAEIYPSSGKVDKQFKYAEKKKIPFVISIGSKEIQSSNDFLLRKIKLKNMNERKEEEMTIVEIIERLK